MCRPASETPGRKSAQSLLRHVNHPGESAVRPPAHSLSTLRPAPARSHTQRPPRTQREGPNPWAPGCGVGGERQRPPGRPGTGPAPGAARGALPLGVWPGEEELAPTWAGPRTSSGAQHRLRGHRPPVHGRQGQAARAQLCPWGRPCFLLAAGSAGQGGAGQPSPSGSSSTSSPGRRQRGAEPAQRGTHLGGGSALDAAPGRAGKSRRLRADTAQAPAPAQAQAEPRAPGGRSSSGRREEAARAGGGKEGGAGGRDTHTVRCGRGGDVTGVEPGRGACAGRCPCTSAPGWVL